MKILFLAASNGDQVFYAQLIAYLKTHGDVCGPQDTKAFQGTPEERYKRAFRLIAETDLIIAEQTEPSTGMGMELREATLKNKPVIIITEDETTLSGLVQPMPNLKATITYKDVNDLKAQLEAIAF